MSAAVWQKIPAVGFLGTSPAYYAAWARAIERLSDDECDQLLADLTDDDHPVARAAMTSAVRTRLRSAPGGLVRERSRVRSPPRAAHSQLAKTAYFEMALDSPPVDG